MTDVRPFGPSQAAELADEPTKAWATLRAKCYLAAIDVARTVGPDGTVTYRVGGRAFSTIEAAEDELDRLQGEA